MKHLFFLIGSAALPALTQAQQLTFSSALHQSSEKVSIYREWPTRQLQDTLHLSGNAFQYTLPAGAPAVYSVHLRKPFVDAVILAGEGPVTISVTKDTQVVVKGGVLQQRWKDFEQAVAPDEKLWNEWGRKYERGANLDEKLKANKESNRYAEKVQHARLQFTVLNADNLLGAWMGYYYAFAWSPANLQQLLPAFRKQTFAKATFDKLQEKQQEADKYNLTGKKAPAFELPAIDGKSVSLQQLMKDHDYVLLDVWASWCTPCRATNRKLAPLHEKLSKKGIAFVSVSVDEKKDLWEKAVAADKIPWTQLRTSEGMKGEFVQQYKVQSLPATFLIDKTGTIIRQHIEIADLEKL
ncbi:TlpA family protein disulfide reductase [Chitinophaga arvensicola]|uniref:Peroxiredoxin n=1 Tax=Chitinophaga arvensicola TaxID=29529 RepID=A0A1I0REI0_9BACT|nr:TlpA disulfide reductase family protein [Chitinophaga arvensicola]SEW39264.1 Peroxiredoxin [Chitinophaga arvensicola]